MTPSFNKSILKLSRAKTLHLRLISPVVGCSLCSQVNPEDRPLDRFLVVSFARFRIPWPAIRPPLAKGRLTHASATRAHTRAYTHAHARAHTLSRDASVCHSSLVRDRIRSPIIDPFNRFHLSMIPSPHLTIDFVPCMTHCKRTNERSIPIWTLRGSECVFYCPRQIRGSTSTKEERKETSKLGFAFTLKQKESPAPPLSKAPEFFPLFLYERKTRSAGGWLPLYFSNERSPGLLYVPMSLGPLLDWAARGSITIALYFLLRNLSAGIALGHAFSLSLSLSLSRFSCLFRLPNRKFLPRGIWLTAWRN